MKFFESLIRFIPTAPLRALYDWRSWSDGTNAARYDWVFAVGTVLVYLAPVLIILVWGTGWVLATYIVFHAPSLAWLVWFAGSGHPEVILTIAMCVYFCGWYYFVKIIEWFWELLGWDSLYT